MRTLTEKEPWPEPKAVFFLRVGQPRSRFKLPLLCPSCLWLVLHRGSPCVHRLAQPRLGTLFCSNNTPPVPPYKLGAPTAYCAKCFGLQPPDPAPQTDPMPRAVLERAASERRLRSFFGSAIRCRHQQTLLARVLGSQIGISSLSVVSSYLFQRPLPFRASMHRWNEQLIPCVGVGNAARVLEFLDETPFAVEDATGLYSLTCTWVPRTRAKRRKKDRTGPVRQEECEAWKREYDEVQAAHIAPGILAQLTSAPSAAELDLCWEMLRVDLDDSDTVTLPLVQDPTIRICAQGHATKGRTMHVNVECETCKSSVAERLVYAWMYTVDTAVYKIVTSTGSGVDVYSPLRGKNVELNSGLHLPVTAPPDDAKAASRRAGGPRKRGGFACIGDRRGMRVKARASEQQAKRGKTVRMDQIKRQCLGAQLLQLDDRDPHLARTLRNFLGGNCGLLDEYATE